MSIVILPNNVAGRDNVAPSPSVKDDGSGYEWRMFFSNNSTIADADSLTELIDTLYPGYIDLDEEGRALALVEYSQGLMLALKVNVLTSIPHKEFEELDAWEQEFLRADVNVATWETSLEEIQVWKSDYPIFLLDVLYAPFTDIPRPVSKYGDYEQVPNIFWFSASSERSFLLTLQRLNRITFGHVSSDNRSVSRRKTL